MTRLPTRARTTSLEAMTITRLSLLLLIPAMAHAAPSLDVLIDATELPRRLLHSQTELELPAGRSSLLYVKWVPGIHAPMGPVQNIAGFRVSDDSGNDVAWERDRTDPYRFFVDAPAHGRYVVAISYITNQPSTNSRSVDSFGYPSQGVVNWNTVMVYPEGYPVREVDVRASLLLPEGWTHGSALDLATTRGDTLVFRPTSFEDFIDKPLIAGRYLATFELASTAHAKWLLHISADEAELLPEENDSLLVPFRNLCHEAEVLFGRTHFDAYHVLLSLSDAHRLGVEHRNSSLNSDKSDTFDDKAWIETGVEVLIPHEISHAWCGKYRRPKGMLRDDFQEAKDTELLWVYEGLDEYLEKVLTVRAGFRTPEVARDGLAYSATSMVYQKGRRWRPLADTAIAGWTLRGGSADWGWLRRSQDYYTEGAFIWLEVDARLRRLTDGDKSLDDFCAIFFTRGDPSAHAVPFDRAEVIGVLESLVSYDWAALFAERVDGAPGDDLPEGLELSGWTLGYTDERSLIVKTSEKLREYTRLYDSIGLAVMKNGKTGAIVPGGPADRAGLVKGLEILGVNGRRFTSDRLLDAVRDTPESGAIELLVDRSGHLETTTIVYDAGLRYVSLERSEGAPDLLAEIFAPRRVR